MRELLPRRVRIGLQESDCRHREARHAEGALESLLIDDGLLHRMKLLAVGESFDRLHLPTANGMCQDGARIVRHVVDEDSAGTTFGAIAADFRARQPEL